MNSVSLKDLDRRWKLDSSARQAIVERRLAGATQREIAEDYGIHQSTVSRVVSDWLKSKRTEAQEQ